VIISASRRTDICAFFSCWFIDGIRTGQIEVPNPQNHSMVRKVSLRPNDVEAIVFWTRDPRPIMDGLGHIEQRGIGTYFHITITPYGPPLEPGLAPLEERIQAALALADRLGPKRVHWRYDPIVLSNRTGPDEHRRAFADMARKLRGRLCGVTVSLLDWYRKTERALQPLERDGWIFSRPGPSDPEARALLCDLAAIARSEGFEMRACCEPADLSPLGIGPARCIDGEKLAALFGREVPARKDRAQRPDCRCHSSVDIGRYGTCRHGCRYCYAR